MYCESCGKKNKDNAKFCNYCGKIVSKQKVVDNEKTTDHSDENILVTPAWRGIRFINYVIDLPIMYGFSYAFGFLLGYIGLGDLVLSMPDYIFGSIIILLYYFISELLWQKTPAKFFTRTKVVDINGHKPTTSSIVGRSFARLIPFDPLSFLVGEMPHGWHDSLSGTYVVSDKK